MLMGFEPLDFLDQNKWESFLNLVKVPMELWSSVTRVVIDSKQVHISQKHSYDINTISYDPDEEFPGQ